VLFGQAVHEVHHDGGNAPASRLRIDHEGGYFTETAAFLDVFTNPENGTSLGFVPAG